MTIRVGDTLPSFTAIDADGNLFDVGNYSGKPLVIYFYPKNETRVCTEQACSFRDQYEDFKALGAEVIGISSDSVQSHQKFSANHQLPFILLSDADKKIRKLFGVPNDYLGLIPGRTTYVADANGIVQLVFDSTLGKIHIEKALQILKNQISLPKNTAMKLYPLQFEPILKERIWGGTKLKTLLNKPIVSNITGESWEISTVENDISVIANGTLKGKSLTDVIETFPTALLGNKVYEQFGKQFPLLFKYLDAREDLSIQVHPNDELAQKRHNSFGKTEMWYVLQADTAARLIVGFKEDSSAEEYIEHLNNKTLLDILDTKAVQPGDVFMLNTGTIHALGAGIVIAEIQQTSDITYRVYDFDRKDANGNTRQLHIEEALEALNYKKTEAQRNYTKEANVSNEIIDCPYFTTNFIPLTDTLPIAKNGESFTVYMCVDGDFTLIANGDSYRYGKGATILVPAELTDFQLSGQASLLEIYIS